VRLACTADGFGRLLVEAPVRAAASIEAGDRITLWYDPAEATPVPS
jgi:hypothetical protein